MEPEFPFEGICSSSWEDYSGSHEGTGGAGGGFGVARPSYKGNGCGQGDPRIRENTPHSLWIRKRDGEGDSDWLLSCKAQLRPQLHLCPWLLLCGLPPGPHLHSDWYFIPDRTQLLGDRISAVDLGERVLSRDSSQE